MLLRLLHRLLEIFLHLERRFEQPFLRPAFDALFREPMARVYSTDQYPAQPRGRWPRRGDAAARRRQDVQTMIDEMRRHLVRDFPAGGFERAGNTKTHGLVRGELIIHDSLPDNLRQGLFATPKTYRCWVRFSGPGPHIEPDINDVGFVSISVKVMGVPGEKLWDDEKHTQDFTAVCTPTFVTPDIKANARLQYWSRRHLPVFYFFDPADAPAGHPDAGPVERDPDQSARRDLLLLRALPDGAGSGDAIQLLADDGGLPKNSAAAVPAPRQLSARQHGAHARRNGCRIRDARPAADRSVPDADREQCGAMAGAPVSAHSGGDAANSATEIRRSGAVRLYPQSEIQSLALPARPSSARQPEPGAQAHV